VRSEPIRGGDADGKEKRETADAEDIDEVFAEVGEE